jgi:hypothetical protein
MARLSNPRSARGSKVKRVMKVSSGIRTGLYNLGKSECVVSLSFQNCDTPKDTVCNIECIIFPFDYAIAGMQSSVSKLATLIRMAETDGRVGGQC